MTFLSLRAAAPTGPACVRCGRENRLDSRYCDRCGLALAAIRDCAELAGLTDREIEVLRLVSIGRSNRDIASALGLSINTVASHLRSILAKTGSANRTEAAAYAARIGLMSL